MGFSQDARQMAAGFGHDCRPGDAIFTEA